MGPARLAPLLVLLLLAAGAGAGPLRGAAGTASVPVFAAPVVIAADVATGEPSLVVDPNDASRLYVAAPDSPATDVWTSADGGASWLRAPDTLGASGDSSLAVDAAGALYAADLCSVSGHGDVPVSVSEDHAATWARVVNVATESSGCGSADRQWVLAAGAGHAYAIWNDGDTYFSKTTDGGRTWLPPLSISSNVILGGPLARDGAGTLYTAYDDGLEIHLLRSFDDGLTWVDTKAADENGALRDFATHPLGTVNSFVVAAADEHGNVYVVWSEEKDVVLVASRDGGATFGPRVTVTQGKTGVFPWVVAGPSSGVDVAFYESNQNLEPDQGQAITTWHVTLAQSFDAASAAPTFTLTPVSGVVHRGSICTTGIACAGPQNFLGVGGVPTPGDRRLYDFFEMRVDPAGNALVAYPVDRWIVDTKDPFDAVFSDESFTFSRQVDGPTLG